MSSGLDGPGRINQSFGERLARLRRRQGLSAQQLSHRLAMLGHDLSRASISQTERGARTVTLADLLAVAQALNVPPVQLMLDFDESDGPQPVVLYGGEVAPAEFVEWWSGRVDLSWLGGSEAEWKAGTSDFVAWQDWIHARARAEAKWQLLSTVASRADPSADETDLLLATLARAAAQAERDVAAAGEVLPWAAPETWHVDHLVSWLQRVGGLSGVFDAVARELSPQQLRAILRAAPSWAPLVEPHLDESAD